MSKVEIGGNTKWTIKPAARKTMRVLLEEGLGAKLLVEPTPTMAVYELPGGHRIGIEHDEAALDDASARKGAWLEIVVDDVPAAEARLLGAGATRVPYHDVTHVYLQAFGGPVFRLAPRAERR